MTVPGVPDKEKGQSGDGSLIESLTNPHEVSIKEPSPDCPLNLLRRMHMILEIRQARRRQKEWLALTGI